MIAKQKPVTNAELAVLSLLAEKPKHGYQIEQTIISRGMREWTEIGFSSIYYILEKLRSRGCVESRLEPAEGKGPSRQVFSLTASGRSVFRQAALTSLARPSRSFSSFQLGLASLPMLGKKEILEALRDYQVLLKDKYFELAAKSSEQQPNLPWHIAGLFEHDLTQLKCELDWLESFIPIVESNSA
jgi:DNA-binding PadR family transcriptional regulator